MGRIYDGRVTSIKDFGAFVEILPGKDGLCHISELADGYVTSVGDVCKVGDAMPVKVIAIDDQDRVKLSRKAALKELGIADDKVLAGGGERPPPRRAKAAAAVIADRDRAAASRGGNGRGRDRDRQPNDEIRMTNDECGTGRTARRAVAFRHSESVMRHFPLSFTLAYAHVFRCRQSEAGRSVHRDRPAGGRVGARDQEPALDDPPEHGAAGRGLSRQRVARDRRAMQKIELVAAGMPAAAGPAGRLPQLRQGPRG